MHPVRVDLYPAKAIDNQSIHHGKQKDSPENQMASHLFYHLPPKNIGGQWQSGLASVSLFVPQYSWRCKFVQFIRRHYYGLNASIHSQWCLGVYQTRRYLRLNDCVRTIMECSVGLRGVWQKQNNFPPNFSLG